MYEFSVPMAIVDFLPVALFLAAAVILMRDLYNKLGKAGYALFSAGVIDVFLAGALQATWKLLYAAGICDFRALNTFFLPAQSIGFLLAGLAVISVLRIKPREHAPEPERRKDETGLEKYYEGPGAGGAMLAAAAAPEVFSGSMVFIGMMVRGLGMMCGGLAALSGRLKNKRAAVFFLAAFICSLGMGYISGLDLTQAWVNWAEEGVNIVSQLLLLIGTIILHKNGLKEYGI